MKYKYKYNIQYLLNFINQDVFMTHKKNINWCISNSIALLENVIKGYPIGQFMIFFDNGIMKIIEGHQRFATLYMAINENVFYIDIEDNYKIKYFEVNEIKRCTLIPFSCLFSTVKYLKAIEKIEKNYIEKLEEIIDIRSYKICSIQSNYEHIIEIYKINNYKEKKSRNINFKWELPLFSYLKGFKEKILNNSINVIDYWSGLE